MRQLEPHPLANIFPLLDGDAYAEFLADVRENGIREPAVLYQEKILDGRNRYRAAQEAEVVCPTRDYVGSDPLGYVISLNLHRRHLDESQRAMVAARLANMPVGNFSKSANLPDSGVSQPRAASLLNVSERSLRSAKAVLDEGAPELVAAVDQGHLAVSVAARATKLAGDDQREIAGRAQAGENNVARKVVKQKARAKREADLATKQRALPQQKFGVIYADPEWEFETWSPEGMDRAAGNHYPTSPLDEIKARDVPSISADDSILFLCATPPMLPHALEVMGAWGFDYVSNAVWIKDRTGTGYWFRFRHDHLLVGVRGNVPCPAPGEQWDSVIEQPRGEHSEKPEAVCELIEAYFPNLPKIELNRRGHARAGWSAWGNEAEALA